MEGELVCGAAFQYEQVPGLLARARGIEASSNGGPPEEPSEAAIMPLLRPYEDPAERLIAKRVERLETEIGKRINAVDTAAEAKLASALGVSAL
jgi:hypothetical protein